jgi:hypothetical protein
MLNLLRLHQLARKGDGLDPAIHALLARRAAVEGDPKVAVLHPGLAFGGGDNGQRTDRRNGKKRSVGA